MTGARRFAAIALCAGLAVGIFAQVDDRFDLPQVIGSRSHATGGATGSESTNGAASSVPRMDLQEARLGAAQDLLSARAAAVRDRDKTSWMATLDLRDGTFRERQSAVFDNLIKLPLSQLSYGAPRPGLALTATRARQLGPGAWAATFTGTYSLAGFDRAPQSFTATYALVQGVGGWRLADDTDGVTPLQMWDLPGLKVLRSSSAIVIGNAPEMQMREYGAIADSAVRRVSGVWGTHWGSQVVILTPSTSQELASLLERSDETGLDQVAAITQGSIDPGQRAQADRVVVNPHAFTALQPIGRRVVITHELTHVAARSSTTGPVPTWLAEGMADYVGYSGLDLPRARVAPQLLARVRQGRGPTSLPREVDFDPARTKIAPSYSASWLAVSHLADLYGRARLVTFYRSVAAATTAPHAVQPDPDRTAAIAFPRSFGVTEAQFVDSWRRYLRTLAKARG